MLWLWSFVVLPEFPILVVTVGAHIAVLAQLGRACGDLIVLPLDARHDVVELRDGLTNGAIVFGEGHVGVAAVLTGVVQVHPADLLAGALLDQMGVDLQLVLVLLGKYFHLEEDQQIL